MTVVQVKGQWCAFEKGRRRPLKKGGVIVVGERVILFYIEAVFGLRCYTYRDR